MNDLEDDCDLSVRVVMEQPDQSVLDAWETRLREFGLVIDARKARSIDAHGPRGVIEAALRVNIAIEGGEARIVGGAALRLQPTDNPVYVYIPRKPTFF